MQCGILFKSSSDKESKYSFHILAGDPKKKITLNSAFNELRENEILHLLLDLLNELVSTHFEAETEARKRKRQKHPLLPHAWLVWIRENRSQCSNNAHLSENCGEHAPLNLAKLICWLGCLSVYDALYRSFTPATHFSALIARLITAICLLACSLTSS